MNRKVGVFGEKHNERLSLSVSAFKSDDESSEWVDLTTADRVSSPIADRCIRSLL
jgi:hypothetical protein